MKIAYHGPHLIVANFERGEDISTELLALFQKEKLPGAVLTGLGAADMLELAYYNLTTKTYERHMLEEEVEILSLTGNFAFLNEKPIVHLHGVFGRRDLSTCGGHIFQCQISGAGEIHITPTETRMTRSLDEQTGLNLLCAQENF